jgi:amino-acid N-acetyltransferase
MTDSNCVIRSTHPNDLARIERLLRASTLPVQGVADHVATFLLAEDERSRLVGVAGFEIYGGFALLRSVAVEVHARCHGLGSVLIAHAFAFARTREVAELFLLTTTAATFFERHGFERIGRSQVPSAVAVSAEFNGVCPESATVMRKRL